MQESAPGPSEILAQWSFDPVWAALLLLVGAAYLLAARWLNRKRPRLPHPRWKTGVFITGVLVVGLATLSPLERYSNQTLWINFTGFLLLTMVAAPLIVLGSPLTLALRVATPAWRARLRRAYRGRVATVVTFPVFTWLLFAVVTYLWQFSALTDEAAHHAILRDTQQLTLLAVALLFWTPALCADPQRWRMAFPLRGLYVFLEMTHKGLFGGMFLSVNSPFHPGFAANAPSWAPAAMTDQRIAILILWIGGNIIFVGALIGILSRWVRYEARVEARSDRRLAHARAASSQRKAALRQVFEKPR